MCRVEPTLPGVVAVEAVVVAACPGALPLKAGESNPRQCVLRAGRVLMLVRLLVLA